MGIVNIFKPDQKLAQTINFFKNNHSFSDKLYKENKKYSKEDYKIYSVVYFTFGNNTLDLLNRFSGNLYIDELEIGDKKCLERRFKNAFHDIKLLMKFVKESKSIPNNDISTYNNFVAHLNIVYETILRQVKQFGYDENKGKFVSPKISDKNPIMLYITQDAQLSELNRFRSRNFILYSSNTHSLMYDLRDKTVFIEPYINFSKFEYEKNRKYAEKACLNLMYNFENKKEYYIKLLKNNQKRYSYHKQIEILAGNIKPTEVDVLVLISLLGRLEQVNDQGPLSTFVREKLKPNLIMEHTETLDYIKNLIYTFEGYRKLFLNSSSHILKIPNADFNFLIPYNRKYGNDRNVPLLELFKQTDYISFKAPVSTNEYKGNVFSHNYIASFFGKFILFRDFINTEPLIEVANNEELKDILQYIKRYNSDSKSRDIVLIGKIRAILQHYIRKYTIIEEAIQYVHNISKDKTYSKLVAEHLLNSNDKVYELTRLLTIYIKHIEGDKLQYLKTVDKLEKSDYNNMYISIASDIHLINLQKVEKVNLSRNFNIIAGDFVHTSPNANGYQGLKKSIDIKGVGVLGNHDIYFNDLFVDFEKELKTNYEDSIKCLNQFFPEVEILNDQIKYVDGYAIVGMTLFYDVYDGARCIFNDYKLGRIFKNDDYLSRAKNLLKQVSSDIPIIFISHSPFKEYSVSNNKKIGVSTNYIFKDFPNVKIYIHGHGHSQPNQKVIQGVLCMSNPISKVLTISDFSFSYEDICKKLGIKNNLNLLNDGQNR